MLLTPLLVSYFVMTFVSLCVAVIIYRGNRTRITKLGVFYWLAVLGSFIFQGAIGDNQFLQGLAMATIAATGYVLILFQEEMFGLKFRRSIFWTPLIASVVLAFILYAIGAPFWAYTISMSLAVAMPFFIFPIRIFKRRLTKTGADWCFLASIIVSGAHLLDYPFLRTSEMGALIGFGGAYFTGFLMSILVPVVTTENLNATYTERLEGDVKKATSELLNTNSLLLDSQRENVNLVRILCHDMNNSLFAVRSSITAMSRFIFEVPEKLAPKRELALEHATTAERALANQAELISNVSMMQKVASKKLKMNYSAVGLLDCINGSLRLLNYQAKQKKVKFSIEVDPDIKVIGDANMLINSVFNNLISNSIKFSYEDATIKIRAHNDGEMVVIDVEDPGVGMSQEKLDKIFSLEGYTSTVGTAGEMGSGFGMPIAQAVVERMAGEISVRSYHKESHPDSHGTVVTVKLRNVG